MFKLKKDKNKNGASESTENESHPSQTRSPSVSGQKDLMISYSHADKTEMVRIRDYLEKHGISVWVDVSGLEAGVDFLSKIGEAIIDCKLFISLLSKSSVKSKYCQDELALAYVSGRAIFPVALDDPKDMYPLMDTGMKLQLARYDWLQLGRDENCFEERFCDLVTNMKEDMAADQDDKRELTKDIDKVRPKSGNRPKLTRQNTRSRLNARSTKAASEAEALQPDQFWKKHFGNNDDMPWDKFVVTFREVFEDPLSKMMSAEEEKVWLVNVLEREMEVEDNLLHKYDFMAFCNIDGDYFPFWERVDDQARESYSMKEVFNMESSVRVEAIENLGKFRSAAVIDALRDLLSDPDANVKAVAAVSLARTEASDPVTAKFLMKTLNDKDRLVREAGCLALGHLKVKVAVSKLLHLWRNDVISHVREAANVALMQIGGPEVEKQMKVTKVLADEIRQLTLS